MSNPRRTEERERRRRLPAAERRDVIEQAATELFAERGYRGAAIDEIARRAGVTPPVVYDHFASKSKLYQALLVRHFAALRDIWFGHASSGEPIERWMPAAVDDWFGYIETNPFAGRMLFRDTTGDPELVALQDLVTEASRAEMMKLLRREAVDAGVEDDQTWMDLTWEILRAVLQGLALWWSDHREVPRERIVQAAMNGMWLGFERVLAGEVWEGPSERR